MNTAIGATDLRFDHLVVLVDDLRVEMERWSQAGFPVGYGGVHAGGVTENALIPLRGDGYLELLASTKPGRRRAALFGKGGGSAIARRFQTHLGSAAGLVDISLVVTDLDSTLARVRSRGLGISDPETGGRERADGVRVEWRTAVPEVPNLPFLIEDVTARDRRVPPTGEAVASVGRIRVATEDMMAAVSAYEAMLGAALEVGAGVARFSVGDLEIEICESCEGGLSAGPVSASFSVDPVVSVDSLPSWLDTSTTG